MVPDRTGLCSIASAIRSAVGVARPCLALAGLCLSFAAAPTVAQDGTPPGKTPDPLVPEANPSLFDRLALAPTYTSSFDVNRTSTGWGQTFNLLRQSDAVEVETNWNLNLKENSAQNDYEARLGRANTRLEFAAERLGGLSAGSELRLQRNFSKSNFDRVVDNGTEADVFVTGRFLDAGVSRLLDLPADALDWTVTGSVGLLQNRDIRQRKRDGVLDQSDSTHADGSSRGIATALRYGGKGAWSATASGEIRRSTEDSKTVSWDSNGDAPDSTVVEDHDNGSRAELAGLNVTFKPNPKTRATLNAQYSRSIEDFFFSIIRQQDRKDGLDRRVSLDVATEPFWGVKTTLKLQDGLTDIEYDVSDQDRGKDQSKAELSVAFKAGPAFSWLQGTEFETELYWEDAANTFGSERTPNYDSEDRRIKQKLRRSLGSKVVVLGSVETGLSQSFYRDGSLDRDELRTLADGAVGYRPTKKLDTRLTMQWQQRQTLNIPSARSAESNTQNSYRVGAQVTCKLREKLEISQRYTITADYSFFKFDENRNGLVRTTEVRSGLKSVLGNRIRLDLDHNYRFKDSGSYIRETVVDPRFYIRATEEDYQYLTVTTGYDFSDNFDIHATQRFETRHTTDLGSGNDRETERVEFIGGVRLVHQFNEDFKLDVRADRTQSSNEDDYWRAKVTVNRDF